MMSLNCRPSFSAALRQRIMRCHENFKIVHDGAEMRVDRQLQLDERAVLVDLQRGLFYGVIHAVVDVERRRVLIAHAAAAHIGLVREDEGGRDGVDRHAGALVVVADGRDDRRDVLGPEAEPEVRIWNAMTAPLCECSMRLTRLPMSCR